MLIGQVKQLDNMMGEYGGYVSFEFFIVRREDRYDRTRSIANFLAPLPDYIEPDERNEFKDRTGYTINKNEYNELGEL